MTVRLFRFSFWIHFRPLRHFALEAPCVSLLFVLTFHRFSLILWHLLSISVIFSKSQLDICPWPRNPWVFGHDELLSLPIFSNFVSFDFSDWDSHIFSWEERESSCIAKTIGQFFFFSYFVIVCALFHIHFAFCAFCALCAFFSNHFPHIQKHRNTHSIPLLAILITKHKKRNVYKSPTSD